MNEFEKSEIFSLKSFSNSEEQNSTAENLEREEEIYETDILFNRVYFYFRNFALRFEQHFRWRLSRFLLTIRFRPR